MWEKIVSLVPDLSKNLKFIMTDYEKAAITIMNQQFPAASIHGCWFHYSQVYLIIKKKYKCLMLHYVNNKCFLCSRRFIENGDAYS